MKRVIIIFIALIAGCYLAYNYGGIVELIGGLIHITATAMDLKMASVTS